MKRLWAIPGGFLLFVFGLPGHFDDGKKWMEWLSMIPMNYWQWWNYLLIVLSAMAFLYAVVPQNVLSWISNRVGSKGIPQQVEYKETTKVYTERTTGEIFSTIGKLTTIELGRVIQPHLGKWIRVQSIVTNIACDKEFFYVLLGKKFEPIAYLRFEKEKWPSIETMVQGDRLAAEGKITEIDHLMMYLDCCEIVELRDNDDSSRQP